MVCEHEDPTKHDFWYSLVLLSLGTRIDPYVYVVSEEALYLRPVPLRVTVSCQGQNRALLDLQQPSVVTDAVKAIYPTYAFI